MSAAVHFVDVFGSGQLSGNPVAVVSGAEALDDAEMLALTRWFNLSETTFLLPPSDPRADYRVRIFTLDRELPFAGHPTLGTCHVWLATAGAAHDRKTVVQECGAGLVSIRTDGDDLAFAAPPLVRSGAPSDEDLAEALAVLGIDQGEIVDAAWVDNGPGWIGIRLASAERVLQLTPARSWPREVNVGAVGPYEKGSDADFEVRAFLTDHLGAVLEDPVTGSLNASLAQWFFATGVVDAPYVARQGTSLGRAGRVAASRDDEGQVWISGATRTHVAGALAL